MFPPVLIPATHTMKIIAAFLLLQGICFRVRRTGKGQNADGRRGVRGSDDFPKGARVIELAEGRRGFEAWIRLENGHGPARPGIAGIQGPRSEIVTFPRVA
jgi:hypothetical protein